LIEIGNQPELLNIKSFLVFISADHQSEPILPGNSKSFIILGLSMSKDLKTVTGLYTAVERVGSLIPDALSVAFGIFLLLESVGCNGIKGPDVPDEKASVGLPSLDDNSSHSSDQNPLPSPSADSEYSAPVNEPVSLPPDPVMVVPVVSPPASEPVAALPSSCADILKTTPTAMSGVYQIHIQLPGATAKSSVSVYCGMDEDNGGWMLVMGYTHKGGTNPPLAVLSKLPLLGSDTLGNDDSANASVWGHASNALLKALSFNEMRFYCRSSTNANVIHFKTRDAACKTAITEGTGSCVGVKSGFTALSKHTGSLPAGVDIADQNKGNATLVDNTFGHIIADGADVMWNVRGDVNAKSWECDAATDNETANTIHRVWVR
jgi:hypothetical protein